MNILSLFAGIGGFDLGFGRAGFKTLAVSEIEKFPCRVLAHRFPEAVNLGDVTKLDARPLAGRVSVVTFGSPCQDLSVAGKRAGLAGERSGLFHEACRIIGECRPEFAVWENVPGALSSNSGRDFGAVLDAMGKCGAVDLAWRVLDARYFGVAQRRRRVFLVADFRGHRAGEILFEPGGGPGDFAPRGETREGIAPSLAARTRGGGGLGTDAECDGALIPEVAWCLQERDAKGADSDTKPGHLIPEISRPLLAKHNDSHDETEQTYIPEIAHTLKGDVFDGSEDGTGRGTPLVPVGFSSKDFGADAMENLSPTLRAGGHSGSHANGGCGPAVAYDLRGREDGAQFEGPHETANLRAASGGSSRSYVAASRVRRLTPRECERLQGFPDDWTNLRGAADGPRYKALGNAVCVNVAEWIGRRVASCLK